MSFPKVVLSILWIRTRRRAAVSSFGSCWRWDWTSMMNAEVTAENRPACRRRQHASAKTLYELTNIRVVFKSSSCFFMNSLS